MQDVEWILVAGFLAVGGFTFLRLVASARGAVVQRAEAERLELERKRAEQAKREQAGCIHEVRQAFGEK